MKELNNNLKTIGSLNSIAIHNTDSGDVYYAKTLEDCKDKTDKSLFAEALKALDTITMGIMIATPVWD